MQLPHLAVVVGLALVLAVAGCAAAPPARASSSGSPSSAVTPVPPVGEKVVTIGFTVSKTGSLNVESSRQLNGLSLWVEQVNAAGGVKLADGTVVKFQTKFYDDESKKERVQELYTRLINDDRADFLVSPYSSGLTDAAAVIAEQYGHIMITAGAASDTTHQRGYKLVYQTYTPASRYLTGAFDLLAHLDPDARIVAIIHENDKFSTDVSNAAKAYGEGQGFTISAYEGYSTGATDFAPFINKIPADTDAVMGGGHFADGSTFAKQLFEKGSPAKLVVLLVAPPEQRFAEIGAGAEGVIGPSQWESAVNYTPDVAKVSGMAWLGPLSPDFVSAYKARFDEEASYHSAGGYAAGLVLQSAIQRADSLDTAKVAAALDASNLMTFFGPLKFDAGARHGLQTGHEMVYIQWQKAPEGNLVKQVVWPLGSALMGAKYPRGSEGTSGLQVLTSLTDGLLLGFVYGVVAMGLTLIWGVMRVINLSHGSVITLGMFGVYFLFTAVGVNPYLAILVVAAAGLLFGLLFYAGAISRVINAPYLSTLLATYAVNMMIIGIGTAVFTTSPRSVDFTLGTLRAGPISAQGTRAVAALAAVLLAGGLQIFLYRTRPGKMIRAVANNRAAAELMGIPTARVLALAFGLGTMLAAVAGALIATFFPFTILTGQAYESKSFVITVLVGLGSPAGALLGGLVLGLLEGIIPTFVPVSWVPVLEFGLFILLLLLRPKGLLGARE